MDYKTINTAILTSRDVPKSVVRDNKFYNYLLSNNVAYYYCSHLSKEKNIMDKKIIAAGNILDNKYIKTLKIINKLCKKNKMKFLLFKTYKYFSEAVDNDIDLFIREKDFDNFIKALEKEGFTCIVNESLKAICLKEGYCKIEPRVDSSIRGIFFLNEKKIWEKIELVNVDGMKIFKATKEIDLLYLLLSILYNPNYLKLYLLLLLKNSDRKKIYKLCLDRKINEDLKFLMRNLITRNVENKRFPLFIGNSSFIFWWCKRILPISKLPPLSKVKLIVFFFYSKYLFLFFNRLVFEHEWPLQEM